MPFPHLPVVERHFPNFVFVLQIANHRLFMTNLIDEYAVPQLEEYDGEKLKADTKEGLDLQKTEDEKTDFEKKKVACDNLCKLMKEVLGDNAENVVVSDRLATAPCSGRVLHLAQVNPYQWILLKLLPA